MTFKRKSLDDSDTKHNRIVGIPLNNLEMSPIGGKSMLRRADSASPSLVGSTLKKLPNRFNHNDIELLPPLDSESSQEVSTFIQPPFHKRFKLNEIVHRRVVPAITPLSLEISTKTNFSYEFNEGNSHQHSEKA
jgi:hypothetical protein